MIVLMTEPRMTAGRYPGGHADAMNLMKDRSGDRGCTMGRTRNVKLAAAIQELGLSQARVAARFRAVAAENTVPELDNVTQSHIARWVGGTRPSGRAPSILCETLSRGLGRIVTPADIGLALEEGAVLQPPEWSVDTLTTLVNLGGTDMDIDRRRVLARSAYSVAGLALPSESWWAEAAERARTRRAVSQHTVAPQDVESIHEMTLFSRGATSSAAAGALAAPLSWLTCAPRLPSTSGAIPFRGTSPRHDVGRWRAGLPCRMDRIRCRRTPGGPAVVHRRHSDGRGSP